MFEDVPEKKGIAQRAWGFCNDSFRTTCCCEFLPHEVAVAAILLAARLCLSSRMPSDWFIIFDIDEAVVQEIARRIWGLYREDKSDDKIPGRKVVTNLGTLRRGVENHYRVH